MGEPILFPGKGRGTSGLSPVGAPLDAGSRIARICTLGLGIEELLGEVCREVRSLLGAEGCHLVSLPEGSTRVDVWSSTLPGEWPDMRAVYRAGGVLGEVLSRLHREGIRAVNDLDRLPPDDPLRSLYASYPVRAALLVPLKLGTRLLGALFLHMYTGLRPWREDEVKALCEVVAPLLSAALDRRRIEDRLRASETRYRFLADHALDFISLHDRDGKYLYASPAALRMLGYRPEEMIGCAAAAFLHPDDREAFVAENRRLASGESAAMTHHHRFRRKEGRYIEVETVSSAVLDERGDVRQVLRVTRDITDRKMMEQRLVESQKLETIGMLAGGVAHEFNNLLVGITGAVEMLSPLLAANGVAKNYLSMIERNGERAVELTRQLLAYARQGKYSPRIISLNRAVLEDVPVVKAALPATVDFRLDLDEELPPVTADIAQIKQVVMSLCLNAGEAMQDGGVLTLRTRFEGGPSTLLDVDTGAEKPGATTKELRSGGAPEGPRVVLEVSDTGSGMDRETLGRIFEPFFTTKFIGRGMGLAAVRGIVDNHEGDIRVFSERGKGTTFTIRFPVASGAPAEGEDGEAPPRAGEGTILVADDEADVREVVGAMLSSLGYRVLEARDGIEALDLFRERHSEINLVLLDLMMPRMTGDRAYAAMRRIRPGVRAILASGYDDTGRIREIVSEGFGAFLQKPFRRRELAQKVDEVLRRWEPGDVS